MNFEEAGSSILELLRGFNAHSVQVQRGWPFLAPLVDKHLHSRSFPAEYIPGKVSISQDTICPNILPWGLSDLSSITRPTR